jgi:glycosyltransferase involved in cell wall biosynthesis
MNILYIHQYFKTPNEPGGTRSYWIARKLIEEGHNVYMLTTSNSISKTVQEEVIDGINVIYMKIPYDNKMGIAKRLLAFIHFMYKSTIYALSIKSINIVIATSTPLTIGFPALILKKLKKKPYLFEVRDLWPEVPIQMGAFKNPTLIKIARWFEKTVYKNATYIVALSPGMKDGVISRNIPVQKVFMIPNMAKIQEFYPREKNLVLEKDLGLDSGSFKIIHFGALGLANGIETIIDTAELLIDEKNIEFIFIGGGSNEEKLLTECRKRKLFNVKFLGKFPMKATSEIINLCDVSIVSFLNLPILYTNSPNKLFDSLSAGKPIIVNSAGWTKELVEEYECGYYVDPLIPQDLANKILYLKNNQDMVYKMGLNSRKLAADKYDKSLLCNEFYHIVELFE